MTDQIAELRVSNDAINDSDELRRRIREEGYLFFRKLQNPDKLWDLRRQMLNKMTPWLVEGTDPYRWHRRYIQAVYRRRPRIHRRISRSVQTRNLSPHCP